MTAAALSIPRPGPTDVETIQLGKEWISEAAGGLNRYYSGLVEALPRVGVGVRGLVVGSHAVTASTSGTVLPFAPQASSLRARLAGARASTRQALAECPGGILVAHFALYAAPCLDLDGARPLVVHFHGPWSAESHVEGAGRLATRVKHWMEARVYRRATRLIVLSRAFARVLESGYGIDGGRIRVVPGGVDTARFQPTEDRQEARRILGWPEDRPVALVVRRLVRRMGLEDLIAAVKQARASVPDLLLMVAGSGPLGPELRRRVADEGLEASVRFLGFVPDEQLPLAYRGADLSVVPSVALEGFGLIVAESLAAGTPVIVTAVGGLPETVEGLSPQCVVHERGPDALAAALTDALRGRLPLPTPEACARHAHDSFDWSVVTRRVRDTYTEVRQ